MKIIGLCEAPLKTGLIYQQQIWFNVPDENQCDCQGSLAPTLLNLCDPHNRYGVLKMFSWILPPYHLILTVIAALIKPWVLFEYFFFLCLKIIAVLLHASKVTEDSLCEPLS